MNRVSRLVLASFSAPASLLLIAAAPAPTLPSMRFVSAEVVSPSTSYYASASARGSSFTGVSGFEARPPEVVEMTRALKNDVDLIYGFVRDQIRTDFAFGLRKGAVGALIDRSGTPFDQNVLFVEMLRHSGYTAQYRVGEITLSGSAFAAWTGVSDAGAACRMLAAGGIPSSVNGSTALDCPMSGPVTSVKMLHVWTEMVINGAWYSFDPSYKESSWPGPHDLAAASGLSSGATAVQLGAGFQTGTDATSGAPFVRGGSPAQLDAYLKSRDVQLLGHLKSSNFVYTTNAVVGIGQIVPDAPPAGGWRRQDLPYYSASPRYTYGDIPDLYRTKLTVTAIKDATVPVNMLSRTLFTDEVYGRRLGFDTNFTMADIKVPSDYCYQEVRLVLDDVVLQTYSEQRDINVQGMCGSRPTGVVSLAIDHPYAAQGGAYADQTVIKETKFFVPSAVVLGLGDTSPELASKWSSEREDDRVLPVWVAGGPNNCDPSYACGATFWSPVSDMHRQGLAANWLAQFSRMLSLQAAVGGLEEQHHHSLGLVSWKHGLEVIQNQPTNPNHKWDFGIRDQYTAMDVDTTLSLTSRTNDFQRVRAASRAIAVAAATLEGSTFEQSEDLPDVASTASRLAWAVTPDNEDPCGAGARRIYDFTGTGKDARATGAMTYEGTSSGCSQSPTFQTNVGETLKTTLNNTVQAYLDAGFRVTAAGEGYLGPGSRVGPLAAKQACLVAFGAACTGQFDPTRQRGGAIVATRFGAAGEVVEVAHALTSYDGVTKGGGGTEPENSGEYDPSRAADVLKDRFIDRSSALGVDLSIGKVGFTTPVLEAAGNGPFPYRIERKLSYQAGLKGCLPGYFGYCYGPPQSGWADPEKIYFGLSGSALEAMGATNILASSGSLVAFLALQDVYARTDIDDLRKDLTAALIGDWWRRQIVGNAATVTKGFSGAQYLRLADDSWAAPMGSPGELTQVGVRTKVRDVCYSDWPGPTKVTWLTSRRWDAQNVTFSLRNAGGDVMTFKPWVVNYDPESDCANAYGFSLKSWAWPRGVSVNYETNTTSLGRALYYSNTTTDAAGGAWTFDYAAPVARSATQRPRPYQALQQIFAPSNPSVAQIQYAYDTLGRVSAARDGVGTIDGANGYQFFIAEGHRSERIDPLGQRYVIETRPSTGLSARGAPATTQVRHIDELGRVTTSLLDGRGRIQQRAYPEGDVDSFAYDARDNTVELRKIAKPNSGLADLVITAGYDATWNKPSWIRDARSNTPGDSAYGLQTDFAYKASGAGAGEIETVTQPTVSGGRPVWRYEYGALGLTTKVTDPTGVVTTMGYDAKGNPTSSTLDPAGVAATTCKVFDTLGNVISDTDPRAGVCP
ncbi:hypothetical protein AS593_07150 [Caulobacter vibrioides]|nr:hypothetical protein AS593_07150 [Caulobacter vibrioides]